MSKEYPPEPEEKFEDVAEIDPHLKVLRTKDQIKEEKYERAAEVITAPSTDKQAALKKEIEQAYETQEEVETKTVPTENTYATRPERGIGGGKSIWRKLKLATLGLFGLGMVTSSSAQATQRGPEKIKDDHTKTVKVGIPDSLKNKENTASYSDGKKKGIEVYTKANTKEGGITPTGLSNSFLENQYGVTPDDIYKVAAFYHFPTSSEGDFQKAMVEHAHTNKPELVQEVIEKFGNTNYGEEKNITDYTQLLDNKLGVRTAFLIAEYKKGMEQEKVKEQDPYVMFAKKGEVIYDPSGHIIAELCYPMRNTTEITEQGNIDTKKVGGVLRLRDDFGFTGEVIPLGTEEINTLFGGTRHLQDVSKLKEWKKEKTTESTPTTKK